MKIGNIAKIINSKVDGSLLDATTYISTENMLPDCGGVTTASSVPSTKVTAFLRDDILLSNIRPYFKKVFFTRFNGGCSNDVICLRADKTECVPQYLYYLLSTDKFIDRFSASSKGTKMPRGDKNALLSYEFPQRSIDEQLYIVDILGTLDDKIENNEKITILLLKKIQFYYIEKFLKKSKTLVPFQYFIDSTVKYVSVPPGILNVSLSKNSLTHSTISSFIYSLQLFCNPK